MFLRGFINLYKQLGHVKQLSCFAFQLSQLIPKKTISFWSYRCREAPVMKNAEILTREGTRTPH